MILNLVNHLSISRRYRIVHCSLEVLALNRSDSRISISDAERPFGSGDTSIFFGVEAEG
jgi:hypothetical protein